MLIQTLASQSTVSASTTYSNYSPAKVLDMLPDTNADGCGCCWSSNNEPDPWLQIQLHTPYIVVKIVVVGRSDQTCKYEMFTHFVIECFTESINIILLTPKYCICR